MDLIIDEGDTQISITWNDQDQKRVEEDYCEGCKTKELRLMIGGLVEKLVGNQVIEKPVVVVEKITKGVLFENNSNHGVWFKNGDENNDNKYVGEIENNKPNGQGTITKPNGDKYVGEFRDGKFHGHGTFTWSNGDKYVGELKDNKRSGQGTYTSHDGTIHVGEWKDNKKNGRGRLTKPNGLEEFGEFKNGKLHGEGKVTTPDGLKIVGEFKDYKPWNVTVYDKDGKTLGKMVDGKRQ